jgi:hypothetical protein
MTNLNRIVMAGAITTQFPFDYVGKAGELTLDTDTRQLYFHDGMTNGGNPLVLQAANVLLSNVQILSAATTPIPVIPAPGIGKAIIVYGIQYINYYGTTPYSGGGGALYYGNTGTQADIGDNGLFTLSYSILYLVTPNQNLLLANIENQAIVYGMSDISFAYTTGDGTGRITVRYDIIDV